MRGSTRVSLVRHGEVSNPRQILYARLPRFSLSEAGVAQAREAAGNLRPAVIYSSPMLRARQTARIISEIVGDLPIHVSSLLTEVATGAQGLPLSELKTANWDLTKFATKGSETADAVRERMLQFLATVVRRHPGRHIAAASHGDPIALLLAWIALGKAPAGNLRAELAAAGLNYPGNGEVVCFELAYGSPRWAWRRDLSAPCTL